jgi:sugar phosphate isomerase/epimerase
MTPPISVQLYSLRATIAERGIEPVLARLADIGYAGVECFGLHDLSPRELKRRVEALGMSLSSSHHPWANRAPIGEVIDVIGELGLSRAAGGFGPDDFEDLDAVKRTAETTNRLVDELGRAGIVLFLHNHWWEFKLLGGRPAYHTFAELSPRVTFEIDTYWAANFGARDPAEEVARVRDRTPLLHIKDGPLEPKKAHVAVGRGKMDIPGVIRAADPQVLEWAIVELDACDTDMMEAVADSYGYLTSNGLAKGRR